MNPLNAPPPDHHLPHRFRQSTFRKYEPAIRAILVNYPATHELSFLSGSAETHLSRIRDSITSLFTHNWTTDIDVGLLRTIRPHLQFCRGRNGTTIQVSCRGGTSSGYNEFGMEASGPLGFDSRTVEQQASGERIGASTSVSLDGQARETLDGSTLITIYNEQVFRACIILANHAAFNLPVQLLEVPDGFVLSEDEQLFADLDRDKRTVTIHC